MTNGFRRKYNPSLSGKTTFLSAVASNGEKRLTEFAILQCAFTILISEYSDRKTQQYWRHRSCDAGGGFDAPKFARRSYIVGGRAAFGRDIARGEIAGHGANAS